VGVVSQYEITQFGVPEGWHAATVTISGQFAADLNAGASKWTSASKIWLCYKRQTKPDEKPITDLAIWYRKKTNGDLKAEMHPPPGFTVVLKSQHGTREGNINDSVSEKTEVLLCFKKGRGPPITAIGVLFTDMKETCPHGWHLITHTHSGRFKGDLNDNTGGRDIYLAYKGGNPPPRGMGDGVHMQPITDIAVCNLQKKEPYLDDHILLGLTPSGENADVGLGAGGDDTYLTYSRSPGKSPIVDVAFHFPKSAAVSADAPAGWEVIERTASGQYFADLHAGVKGSKALPVYIAVRRSDTEDPLVGFCVLHSTSELPKGFSIAPCLDSSKSSNINERKGKPTYLAFRTASRAAIVSVSEPALSPLPAMSSQDPQAETAPTALPASAEEVTPLAKEPPALENPEHGDVTPLDNIRGDTGGMPHPTSPGPKAPPKALPPLPDKRLQGQMAENLGKWSTATIPAKNVIYDIGVASGAEMASVPPHFSIVSTSVTGRNTGNLNQGTKGQPLFLCISRTKDHLPGGGAGAHPITAVAVWYKTKTNAQLKAEVFPPPGYEPVFTTLVDMSIANLNQGASDRTSVFLCVRRDPNDSPITNIGIVVKDLKEAAPPGWHVVERTHSGLFKGDINDNTGGRDVYICYEGGTAPRCGLGDSRENLPLTELAINFVDKGDGLLDHHAPITVTPSMKDADLSTRSASGWACYLSYARGGAAPPITDVGVYFPALETIDSMGGTWEVVEMSSSGSHTANLAAGDAHGRSVFLCIKREAKPPLVNLCVVHSQDEVPADYTVVYSSISGCDANIGEATSPLFLCYKRLGGPLPEERVQPPPSCTLPLHQPRFHLSSALGKGGSFMKKLF